MVDSTETQMDDDSEVQQTSNSGSSKQLSELGLKIFQTEVSATGCILFLKLFMHLSSNEKRL